MKVVELSELELLTFHQDVSRFKQKLDNIDEAVRSTGQETADLMDSIRELCKCLQTMTMKFEEVLTVNSRLEQLLLRIEIIDEEDDTNPNTSITDPKRITDIRELQPPDIFAPCENCKEYPCKCIYTDNKAVCESCLEDPCNCMRQYDEQVSDTSL